MGFLDYEENSFFDGLNMTLKTSHTAVRPSFLNFENFMKKHFENIKFSVSRGESQRIETFKVLANAVTDLIDALGRIAVERRQRGESDQQPLSHARLLEPTATAVHSAVALWPAKSAKEDLLNLTYELMGLAKNLDSQSYPSREQPTLDQEIAKITSVCATIVRRDLE